MLRDLLLRFRSLFRRNSVETELDDELRFHREQQLEKYLRSGMSAGEARRRLNLEFGGLDQIKEEHRSARGVSFVEHTLQDARYAMRSLIKTPAFTVVAVLTLGLGLGANTAIFSVVYGVLLRPLPLNDPSTLVVMHETTPKVGDVSVAYPNFLDWRTESRAFSAMSVVCDLSANLGGVSQPETIDAEAVSSNFLSMIGVRPRLGRDFSPAEDVSGAAPVALLTDGLWRTHFGADPGVVGRTISLDSRPVTVIGVLPAGFRSLDAIDLLEPVGVWLTGNDRAANRGDRSDTVVVGRLAGGANLASARAELDGIAARLASVYPDTNGQFGVALQPIREVLVGDVRPALLVLFGAVVCVLLIACANVANLCLIRGASRTREIALRVAIGAGRGRIVSQLLVESAVLALLGGLLGLAFAVGGIRGLAWLMPMSTLGGASVALSGPVLAFAATAILASIFVFGLMPALQVTRPQVTTDLNDGGRGGSAGRRQQQWRRVLAIAEVSLALVLLVAAGLMIRSLSRLLSVDSGVQTDHVLTMHLDLRSDRYKQDQSKVQFWRSLLDGVSGLPGVEAAALGTGVPLTNEHSRRDITIEGGAVDTGALPHPDVHVVTPAYASTLGIRLLQGRVFTELDTPQSPYVGLIDRSIADRFFAGTDPVGRRFTFGRTQPGRPAAWITIVGVLEDTRLYGLDNPSRLEVYLPFWQSVRQQSTLVVKSAMDPAALVPLIRSVAASLDRDQPLADISTMNELLGTSVSTRRMTLVLLSVFSTLALVLAAIGIYGVMSYSVAQRTTEFGIRLALGAQWTDVLKTIAAQGLGITGAGIAIGVVVSAGVTRLMSGLLFGVSAVDPVTFVAVVVGVILVALVACAIPGWRALRINPLRALRHD